MTLITIISIRTSIEKAINESTWGGRPARGGQRIYAIEEDREEKLRLAASVKYREEGEELS